MRKIQTVSGGERARPRPPPKAKQPTGVKSAPKSTGKRTAKRFVAPVRLDEAAREAIIGALESAGIGDASGREIFVGALGYDLANLLQAVADETQVARPASAGLCNAPAQPAAAELKRATALSAELAALGALTEAARSLQAQLTALDDGGRERLSAALRRTDRFARDHGAGYLAALDAELAHLAAAADAAKAAAGFEGPPVPKPAPAKPAGRARAEAATLAFVRHVARVYSQCFDQAPSAKTNAPFAKVLRIIAKLTDAPLTLTAETLRRALADGADTGGA